MIIQKSKITIYNHQILTGRALCAGVSIIHFLGFLPLRKTLKIYK